MSELVVEVNGHGLVAGLTWKPFAGGNPASDGKAIRNLMQSSGATHYVCPKRFVSQIGLYSSFDLEEGAAKLLPLAAVVSAHFPQFAELAIVWVMGERVAVIAVVDGRVAVDSVLSENDGRSLLARIEDGEFGGDAFAVVTNDGERFGGSMIEVDQLVDAVDPDWQLRRRPINWLLWLAAVIGVAVVGSGLWYHAEAREREAERARAIRAAANDPNKVYQRMLATALVRFGFDRADLANWVNQMRALPRMSDGWTVAEIACAQQHCTYTYNRVGGAASTLGALHKGGRMTLTGLDKAEIRLDNPIKGSRLVSAEALPAHETNRESIDVYQAWRDAGITVQLALDPATFELWPRPPNLTGIRQSNIVLRGKVELDAPLALLGDVIASAPANVFWESVAVRLGNDVRAQLKGHAYVWKK